MVAGSKWHDEAMLDEGITTRYGVLPLMPSRQNPCGKPATRLRLLLSAAHSVSEPESSPNSPPPARALSLCSITTYLGTVSQWST